MRPRLPRRWGRFSKQMKKLYRAYKTEELKLIKAAKKYANEERARTLLESLRWPNGPICPSCGFDEIYKLKPKPGSKSSARKGVYKCAACRNQFTVTVGTAFEGSRIPLSKWVMAVFILCSSSNISTRQLHRMLGITYKSAWLMVNRIRHAIELRGPAQPGAAGTIRLGQPDEMPAINGNKRGMGKGHRTSTVDVSTIDEILG